MLFLLLAFSLFQMVQTWAGGDDDGTGGGGLQKKQKSLRDRHDYQQTQVQTQRMIWPSARFVLSAFCRNDSFCR